MKNKYQVIFLLFLLDLFFLSPKSANCGNIYLLKTKLLYFNNFHYKNRLFLDKEKDIIFLTSYHTVRPTLVTLKIPSIISTFNITSQYPKQESINSKRFNRVKDSTNIILKTSPFVLFGGDYITNSLGAGLSFEKNLSDHLSLNFGLFYIFSDKIFDEKVKFLIAVDKLNGIQSEIEIRRYLNVDIDKKQGIYLSGCFKLLYTKATLKLSQEVVERYTMSPYINIGYEGKSIKSNFIYDFTFGIGPKYVTSELLSNRLEATVIEHNIADRWKDYSKGSILFTSFNVGFNIGYIIN